METKISVHQLEVARFKCNMDGCFGVERIGMSGGLALLWKQLVSLSITSYSTGHIDSTVTHPLKGPFRLTGFYGHLDIPSRHLSWQLLECLNSLSTMDWFVIGDFNEMLSHSDKKGGRPQAEYQIDHFRRAVDNCLLRPVSFSGYKFTWSNRQIGAENVQEYIDDVLSLFMDSFYFQKLL